MASIFNTGVAPSFSKEQRKERRLAWKPSSIREKMHTCAPGVVVFRSEKAQAERDAREAQKAAEKAAIAAERAAVAAAKKQAKTSKKA